MESKAAVKTMEAVEASVSALAVLVRRGTGNFGSTSADPLRDQADACLDGLAEVARAEARLAALKVHFAAGYADAAIALAPPAVSPQAHTAQDMAVTAEVACVLTVSERTAGALLAEAQTLTNTLPLTMSALQSGSISWQHARIMVDETTNLDKAGAAGLEAHFLDPDAPAAARGCPAGELVPARFRAKVRTWRERHHPVSIEVRHARGVADRRVEYTPDRDGMAWLSAYLPASQAAGIWDRTTAAARALQGADEARTLTQLRADVAATWLLTAGRETAARELAGKVPSPAAQVLITVPVLSLLSLSEEPAMLDGYGPVPPSMGRALVADGASSFLRVLTDPRDGAPLEIGRASYRISKALRQWLRLRDGKCPFPGCNNQSLDNDADHLLAWARGGTTGISNLGQPCRKHHRLKHTTGWTPTSASANEPPGWTSPAGRHYASEQPDWEPPLWPSQILAMTISADPGTLDPDILGPGMPDYHDDPPPECDLTDRPLAEDPFTDWELFLAYDSYAPA
ncbi:HNH endonuclease signature motif containing protein [Arthrobacter sp. Leaf337]|uniref:HNH endonuclease signature motif containing protein n=1 Tax=Arthrobacter sp. Leaf337 TaxID=1736342 RepID=UPI0009EC28FF|nr:HNH endonuclease signature motif containing protein [Arthrobacter sp. Leaf337]